MPPPERPPGYQSLGPRPPGYLPPGRHLQPAGVSSSTPGFAIGSVGRRPERVQPLLMRSPLDFDIGHAIFHQIRFELMPIPDHALGVAYVNYRDSKWMFARRTGHYHVVYRSANPPYSLQSPQRLSFFIREAIARVGTSRWNSSRWFYIHWDTAAHGIHGDPVL